MAAVTGFNITKKQEKLKLPPDIHPAGFELDFEIVWDYFCKLAAID